MMLSHRTFVQVQEKVNWGELCPHCHSSAPLHRRISWSAGQGCELVPLIAHAVCGPCSTQKGGRSPQVLTHSLNKHLLSSYSTASRS